MKTDYLNNLKETNNYTYTENGAIALRSTMNGLLDAFGSLAAMRNADECTILRTWDKAFYDDPKMAMRLLFYVRDIRGGQGMRRVFRTIVKNLACNHPELVSNNLDNFLFFGRGDDLLCLMGTPMEDTMIEYVMTVLNADMKSVAEGGDCSLMAKWMPSINTSSKETKTMANRILKKMGMNAKEYRQMLSVLRSRISIVESKMSQNKWDEIDYSKLPAKAAMLYREAFIRHDKDKYISYLKDLTEGKAKVNADSLFPVDIVHKVFSEKPSMPNKYLFDAMWRALPNYFEGKDETGFCVVDVSGSMLGGEGAGIPLEVAISLGMYCADKAKGPFHNHFITFSANPKLQEIYGKDIFDKIHNMEKSDWGMNTDMEAVFELILQTAIKNHTPQEDLPAKLYIISDMQFDVAVGNYGWGYSRQPRNRFNTETFMETMAKRFEEAGYKMPAIVYWNVNASNCGMFQEKYDAGNCCMVSGYSPSLFKAVINGTTYEEVVDKNGEIKTIEKLDPMTVMLNALKDKRYDRVYTG